MQLSRCLIFLTITFGISLCDDDPVSSDNIVYKTPILNDPSIFYYDHFDDVTNFRNKWVKSQGRKKHVDGEAEYDGAWEIEQPSSNPLPGDFGLVMKNKAKHSAISSMLKQPFKFELKPLIVQYEVQFQEGQECGGAYLKLLSNVDDNKNLSQFTDLSMYSIMFGPDKCGNDFKLHFIFKHQNPLTGLFEEKHCKKPEVKLDGFFSDKKPHLYTLILYPDNTFKVLIDHNVVNQGSLLSDFTPQVNPPAEIDDPTDVRPADWDFREKIPDPTAKKADDWDEDAPATIPNPDSVKPEGWLEDEPVHIPDPDAEKPSDWDEEMDGEWEAPLIVNPACQDAMGCGKWVAPPIDNPNYKGKWIPPLIDNPNYKGEWKPRRIPNPNYFEDNNPFKMTPILAVGFELWSMSPNILFDNLVITDNEKIAEDIASKTFDFKNAYFNKNDDSFFSTIVSHTKQKPWLWAVYIVLLLVPVVLAVLFCFGATAKDKDLDKDAMRKKTDDPEADDEVMPDNAVLDEKEVTEKGDTKEEVADQPSEDVVEPQEFDSSDEMEEDQEDEASDEKTSPDKKSPHSRRVRAD